MLKRQYGGEKEVFCFIVACVREDTRGDPTKLHDYQQICVNQFHSSLRYNLISKGTFYMNEGIPMNGVLWL